MMRVDALRSGNYCGNRSTVIVVSLVPAVQLYGPMAYMPSGNIYMPCHAKLRVFYICTEISIVHDHDCM